MKITEDVFYKALDAAIPQVHMMMEGVVAANEAAFNQIKSDALKRYHNDPVFHRRVKDFIYHILTAIDDEQPQTARMARGGG